jgi:hypothetical protein
MCLYPRSENGKDLGVSNWHFVVVTPRLVPLSLLVFTGSLREDVQWRLASW